MHEPTPHARRVAALRFQAEQLNRDAAAWGCEVRILSGNNIVILRAIPNEQSRQPDLVPQQGGT